MKHLLNTTLLLITLFFACGETKDQTSQTGQATEANTPFACQEKDFESSRDWANAILEAYQNASDSTRADQKEWEKQLFCLFPENFDEMVIVFGSVGEEQGPLHNQGYEIVKFFGSINSIPKDIYYQKFINININGQWQGDNIRNGFGLTGHFESDIKNVVTALNKKTDAEIESVFRFIYDSPHPENYQSFYESVRKILVAAEDERLINLNAAAFFKLIGEEHDH